MKEYGGYIELETFHGKLLHEKAIALNCGRSALAYFCEAKKIEKLYFPYFLCSSVFNLCDKLGIAYDFYHITKNFKPLFSHELDENEWLYIVNYYGQLNNEAISELKRKYKRIIVDNAQSYFQLPAAGVDTFYTCRKFFGVADGAFLYTDKNLERALPLDESYERMHFLLGRYERSANEFYGEYVANNKLFADEQIKAMSKLTKNLLRGIDYEAVAKQRQENFAFLHTELKTKNKLDLTIPYGAFMYPLMVDNGMEIRKKLQQMKIYIPTLWPNVLEECEADTLEYKLAADILPIPVDQRYGIEDMEYLTEVIKNVSTERA